MTPEKIKGKMMSGPLPGENYLSNTKNQPWHRPPRFTSMNDAMDYVIEDLMSEGKSSGLIGTLDAGIPVTVVTQMYLIQGIGKGNWTPDFALMMAGPTAHVIKLMADGFGIKYDMGFGKEKGFKTGTFAKNMMTPSTRPIEKELAPEGVPATEESNKDQASGFMEGF